MVTSTTPRRKEQVKPVTGSVRWLRPLLIGKQLGRISITNANNQTTEYDIGAFTDKHGVIQGFGLAKDDDEVYAIDTSQRWGWTCDCADCQFRSRECKHIKAVKAALASAAIQLVGSGEHPCSPAALKPAPEPEQWRCPECRTWSASPFCMKCPI